MLVSSLIVLQMFSFKIVRNPGSCNLYSKLRKLRETPNDETEKACNLLFNNITTVTSRGPKGVLSPVSLNSTRVKSNHQKETKKTAFALWSWWAWGPLTASRLDSVTRVRRRFTVYQSFLRKSILLCFFKTFKTPTVVLVTTKTFCTCTIQRPC